MFSQLSGEELPMVGSWINVQTRYVAPSEPSLPALAVRTTRLVDTYMLWVGTTDQAQDEVENAPSQGFLARDWACAMPPRDVSIIMAVVKCMSMSFLSVHDLRADHKQRPTLPQPELPCFAQLVPMLHCQ